MSAKESTSKNGYIRIDAFDENSTKELADNYRNILKIIGEDIFREGLDKTPERVARFWDEFINYDNIEDVLLWNIIMGLVGRK